MKIRYWRIEPPFFLFFYQKVGIVSQTQNCWFQCLEQKRWRDYFLPVNLANDSEAVSVIQKESCACRAHHDLTHNVVMKGKLGFLLVALLCTCFFLFTARSCFSGGQNFWETLFKSKFLFKTLLKLDLTMTAWFLKIGNYLSQKGNINAAGNMDPDFPCFSQQVFFCRFVGNRHQIRSGSTFKQHPLSSSWKPLEVDHIRWQQKHLQDSPTHRGAIVHGEFDKFTNFGNSWQV